MNDTAIRRLLERLADLTIVGLLTLVSSLPVLTALAAATAAVTVLADGGRVGGGLPSRYFAALRQSLRATLMPQVILLAALAIGAVDLVVGVQWVASGEGRWWTGPVLAVGVLLLGASLVLPAYLAVVGSWPQPGWQPRLVLAAGLAYGNPGASTVLAGLAVSLTAVAVALPVMTPLLVGLYLHASLAVVGRVAGRLERRRTTSSITAGVAQ